MTLQVHRILIGSYLPAFALAIVLVAGPTYAGDAPPAGDRLSQLIEQLGHEEYSVRERAQNELQRLGLPALDALISAQESENAEIALRARYLVRGLQTWTREDDPLPVKAILRDYAKRQSEDRPQRIEKLADLPQQQGWEALCRIVRYESDERHSRQAALALMRTNELEESRQTALIAVIRKGIGENKRTAAQWMRAAADAWENRTIAESAWDRFLDRELAAAAEGEAGTTPEIAVRFARLYAEKLEIAGKTERALETARRSMSVVEPSDVSILEQVGWLGERGFWILITETADRFRKIFEVNAILLYREAEAYRRMKKPEQAEAIAKAALAIHAGDAAGRMRTGFLLQERGLFDWSEREYRELFAAEKPESLYTIYGRIQLSEMFHDQFEELKAAETLRPLVDLIEKDEKVRELLEDRDRDPDEIESRMHYFYFKHHTDQGDRAAALEALEHGLNASETDVDLLIALYRLENRSPEDRKLDLARIHKAINSMQEEVKVYTQQWQDAQQQGVAFEEATRQQLATALNQYAWLVGNTEGDYDGAVSASRESLRLRPKTGAYLDTLARCYFAKKDYAGAVKYQQEALKLDPYSGLMRRQLEVFRKHAAMKG